MEAPLSNQPAYLLPTVTAVHPPDLDTDDSSLATVVLPAPPPLASITGQRRDTHLKRPTQVFSYLPASDPGSTYSGLMGGLGLSLVPEDQGRLRKRPRVDKTAINDRAQRASARNLTPTIAPPLLSPPDPHPSTSTSDSLVEQPPPRPNLRRTHSTIILIDDPTSDTDTPPNKSTDKGKPKEKAPVRVKEEPQAVSLDMLEPLPSLHANDDHCSACRSQGALVYCDGCPRAFHLWCLDPPLDAQDIPENRWYCPACVVRQNPPPKPRRSILAPLLHQLQLSIPTEFELPEDIRGFFKDVTTGPKGAYQDSSETRIARSSRFAFQDEREPFRLKDKNSAPVLCFRCGKSALPDSDTASGPGSSSSSARETRGRRSLRAPPGEVLWKSIVSCDHCTLHWHLDCLDPPLSCMPPAHKKWMCPAHVEHIAPKRRVPRQVAPVTDVTERNRPNNGNIEIIPADNGTDKAKKMAVDEIHINGRRYRVPERVIVLDFWDKLQRRRRPPPTHGLLSGLSSPLTSLSSLDEIGPSTLPCNPQPPESSSESSVTPAPDPETMRAVELLFGCRTAVVKERVDTMEVDALTRGKSDMAVQTEPESCVKNDVHDAKQLSGLISATLEDLNHPESPQPVISVPSPPITSRSRVSNSLRPRAPGPGHSLRKSSRLPSDTASTRVTRSKATPAAVPAGAPAATTPAAPSPPQQSKTETSIASPPARAARVTRSATESAVIRPSPMAAPSPGERAKHTRSATASSHPKTSRKAKSSSADASKPADISASTSGPLKIEASGSTVPPIPNRSPFKIRIPRAINTAVAAATAAAAAASASASSGPPQSTDRARSRQEIDSASDSDGDSYVVSAPVRIKKETSGVKSRSNGRRARSGRKFSASFQASTSATSPRVTRSVVANPKTPTRARRDINPFDRSPQYTDFSDSGVSDFIPGTKRPRKRISKPNGVEV